MVKFLQWYKASGDGRKTRFLICSTPMAVWYPKTTCPMMMGLGVKLSVK